MLHLEQLFGRCSYYVYNWNKLESERFIQLRKIEREDRSRSPTDAVIMYVRMTFINITTSSFKGFLFSFQPLIPILIPVSLVLFRDWPVFFEAKWHYFSDRWQCEDDGVQSPDQPGCPLSDRIRSLEAWPRKPSAIWPCPTVDLSATNRFRARTNPPLCMCPVCIRTPTCTACCPRVCSGNINSKTYIQEFVDGPILLFQILWRE